MQLSVENKNKPKQTVVSFSPRFPISGVWLLTIAGKEVETIKSFKILRVTMSNDLSWKWHVDYVHSKANQRLHFLCMLKRAGGL